MTAPQLTPSEVAAISEYAEGATMEPHIRKMFTDLLADRRAMEEELDVLRHDHDWARDLLKRTLEEFTNNEKHDIEMLGELPDEIQEFFQTTATEGANDADSSQKRT